MNRYLLIKKIDKTLRCVGLGLCAWCSIPVLKKNTRCNKCQKELEAMRYEECANDAYEEAMCEARMMKEDMD